MASKIATISKLIRNKGKLKIQRGLMIKRTQIGNRIRMSTNQDNNGYEDDRIDIVAEDFENETMQRKFGSNIQRDSEELSNDNQCIMANKVSHSDKNEDPEAQYYLSVHKAGMGKVDKERVHKIIQESSKSSEFYRSEEKKLVEVKERCRRYQEKVDQIKKDPIQFERMLIEVKTKTEMLKKERCLRRTWIQVDMDAFYAAVEIRDDPNLEKIPIAVAKKNMIMTTNYKAREFGVRSGVPSFIGKRLCPEMKLIEPNFDKYRKASDEFKSVLYKYDNDLEAVGLDEVNMDVTEYLIQHRQDNQEGRINLATKIRKEIQQQTRMTASCGIACNKMLAKICSDMNKPNGQTYLHNSERDILEFMKELPVRKLVGVGKVNEQILLGMNIKTCSDVIDKAVDIYINFTENAFDFLVKSAIGIARNTHEEAGIKKSLNISQTFQVLSEFIQIKAKLEELCEELEQRAKHEKLSGRTLTLEFKNDKFKNKQRSYTQNQYIWKKEDLFKIALSLLQDAWPLEPTRQISVKLLNLKNDKGQLSATATEVNHTTGGRTKLGGVPKENQPKALKATKVQQVGDGCLQKIIHHKIPSLYAQECNEAEIKKQKQKQFWAEKHKYKYKAQLNAKFNAQDRAQQACPQNESILKTKTTGVYIPYRKGFIKKWTPINYKNLEAKALQSNPHYKQDYQKESIVEQKEEKQQDYKDKYRSTWMGKSRFGNYNHSYYNNGNNYNQGNSYQQSNGNPGQEQNNQSRNFQEQKSSFKEMN
eukprot:403377409